MKSHHKFKTGLLIILLSITLIQGKAQCFQANSPLDQEGWIVTSSGNKRLDDIIMQERFKLENFFGVKVDFFFLIENYGGNAMYIPTCNYACNGSIFLGVNILSETLAKPNGVENVKAILAHEFAHCVQHIMGWKEIFVKRQELHADFMAGFYIGKSYSYSDEIMNTFYNEFYARGDYNFYSTNHHGTSEERMCAFLEGYYFSKESSSNVYEANNYGIQYVNANNPCLIRRYFAVQSVVQNNEKSNNFGSLEVKVNGNTKYIYETTNNSNQTVYYYLNFNNITSEYNYNGFITWQKMPKVNTITIEKCAVGLEYPFRIWKYSFLTGKYIAYEGIFSPQKGKKSQILLEKRSANTNSLDGIRFIRN
jgi:hypothetical protein